MSIYGALFSGVSALSANSQALGVIADNISNLNTVGFKSARMDFSTLVTQASTEISYTPGGVQARPTSLIDKQGLLQSSASPTDLAISGEGLFVVNTSPTPSGNVGEFQFTRAGSFTTDELGKLKNSAGLYLQGYLIDAAGNIPSNRSDLSVLSTVNISGLSGTATPTSSIALKANLQSSQTAAAYVAGNLSLFNASGGASGTTPHFERSIDIFDSKGGRRTLTFGFFRDAALPANQWRAEIYAETPAEVTNANGLLSSGIVAFNTNGTLNTAATTLSSTLNITTYAAALGIANSAITLGLGTNGQGDGLTQFDAPSTLLGAEVDGAVFGSLNGVAIDEDGVVTALFGNGTRRDIYKLPVATFANYNGISSRTGNAYISTSSSGLPLLQLAREGGAGVFVSSALESSTVDLASEFSTLITTQRAYSAATRIITTADEMLDELIRIKR